MHNFRQRLLAGERLIGTMVTLDSPEVVEILCRVGFDWLFFDAEHAPLDAKSLQRLLQAAGQVPCLVRVAAGEEIWIKKALDAGAAGIVVPQVNTAAKAQQIVNWAKYPPLGTRGVGIARAQGFGLDLQDYLETANDRVTVVVQAEHSDAVENIDAICSVDGIDAVFVGPNDLAASMGKPGELTDSAVLAAIDRITAACVAADTRLGTIGLSGNALEAHIKKGYSLLLAGIDTLFLGHSATALLEDIRGLQKGSLQ